MLYIERNPSYSSRNTNHCSARPPPGKNNVTPPFRTLVDLFEKLRSERRQDVKKTLLSNWINGWREKVGKDFFPLLRLLLPHLDKERVYGLKEATIANLYIDLFRLQKSKNGKESHASQLIKWRQPTGQGSAPGDFSAAIFDLANKHSEVTESTSSIKRINDFLDNLSNAMKDQ
ncbi:hypothetical protein D9757_003980 [Collybiopsis confluens]|uniref:DNA ligase ATP-dependent N-terminal domain-containing protein n=1 Tax=Collybiopsis confluens TaxID=2823264 RepID=A0A8H5HWW7_9AGAR|nr:hypothetical protein D9757_003980 [Collybiopsis confluens]